MLLVKERPKSIHNVFRPFGLISMAEYSPWTRLGAENANIPLNHNLILYQILYLIENIYH